MPAEAIALSDRIGVARSDSNYEGVRARVRNLLESPDLSQSAVARQAGISHAALNQFLQCRYIGDNAAVAAKLEQWLSSRARAEALNKLPRNAEFVETPTAKRILSTLSHAQWMADIVEVSGAPGIGKTRAALYYKRSNPSVFYSSMSPGCAAGVAAFEQLCEDLDIPNPPQGVRRMARAIREKIADTKGILIIDECQHLGIPALDEIRSIYDRAGVGVALLGSEVLPVRMAGRGGNTAQILSRMGRRLVLRRPVMADASELVSAWGITDREARKFLCSLVTARGGLRAIVKTINLATLSRHGEVNSLTEDDMRAAWETLVSVD